jgi:uncharacterized protein (DUF2132 family)
VSFLERCRTARLPLETLYVYTLSRRLKRSVTYTLPLPQVLAPSFRGKALKFAYELSLVLNINLNGMNGVAGDKQKTHQVSMPIKIFPMVDGEFT